jgi:hypothetical protein
MTKFNKKTVREAATEAGLDDNKPIIATGVKGMKSTSFRKKFRNMAAYEKWTDSEAFGDFDVERIFNEGATVTKTPRSSKINEGVLDDIDDDGFMAKRQLYDLAKYSVELHRMIQDTDNLEPWISAKITTAAEYIDTVKHYMAYNDIDSAEDMAGAVGLDDIADVEMSPEMSIEEVTEFEDDGDTLSGDEILRMMVARRIISVDMYNLPSDTLLNAADEFAMDLGTMYELGSSDISILMKEFVQQYPDIMDVLDGERAHVYESEKKARSIYKRMLSGLQEKRKT